MGKCLSAAACAEHRVQLKEVVQLLLVGGALLALAAHVATLLVCPAARLCVLVRVVFQALVRSVDTLFEDGDLLARLLLGRHLFGEANVELEAFFGVPQRHAQILVL